MPAGRIATRHYINGTLTPIKQHPDLQTGLYSWERFDHQPVVQSLNVAAGSATGYGNPTGAISDQNFCQFRRGLQTINHVKVGQTLLSPLLDPIKGVEVSQDQTNTHGIEHVFGGAVGTYNPFAFTIGTDNVFARLKFSVTTVANATAMYFGWRKNQAFATAAAGISSYTDYAAINVSGGTPAVATQLASGGVVTTNSTLAWANGETHELMIKIIGTQAVFFFDGNAIKGIPTFNFANAAVILPFFWMIQPAAQTTCFWREFECGHLSQINQNGLNS